MKVNYSNHPKMVYVPKNWGHELWISNSEKYCGKRLFMAKGCSLSLHFHLLKEESFFVERGKLKVFYHDDHKMVQEYLDKHGKDVMYSVLDFVVLEEGDNFHVPPGLVHQMIALKETVFFEFSTQHFDEDSHRILKGD